MLCCTRTLAAGVNLPARRVIFRSLKGWPEQLGGTSKWDALLRVNDYRQMAGRAGRAGLADYGESILVVAGARQRAAATTLLASATEPMRSCLSRDSEGGYLTLTPTLSLSLTLTLTPTPTLTLSLSLTPGIPRRRAASRSNWSPPSSPPRPPPSNGVYRARWRRRRRVRRAPTPRCSI